jgi:hypothetical protein
MPMTAEAILARQEALAAERGNWESLWQEIAERGVQQCARLGIRKLRKAR